MIWWIVIGLVVLALGGWGALALWLLPYPDTASLLPKAEQEQAAAVKV